MIKELPTRQLDLVKQEVESFNSHQRLFLNTLETFITAQETLSHEDITDFIKKTKAIGAPDFADMVGTIVEMKTATVRVPVQVREKFFNAGELADICGVSVQMVRRECEKGNIQASKGLKNSWIISENELKNPTCQRWLENKQTMWSQMKHAKAQLQDSEEFIHNLKDIEENRKN